MAVIIGIDEAGYGPIMGPLVVSAATFEVPDELLDQSLWDILRQSVCRHRSSSAGRIVINDSKKLYTTRGRYDCLQRGVLASLYTASDTTQFQTFGRLLQDLDSNCSAELSGYPWYASAEDWPLRYDHDDIVTASAAFANDMSNHNIRLLSLWSRPLFTGEYNRLVEAVNNKASVLFSLICELIHRGTKQYSRQNLQIVIDKQSGRSHYRQPLQRMFPDFSLKILKEVNTLSSYLLTGPDNTSMKIHFLQKGDQQQLPIALASMAGKYLRELFLEMLNGYFRKHCPEITPTAGYYTDGRRFLNDLKSYNLPSHLTPDHLLVRQR